MTRQKSIIIFLIIFFEVLFSAMATTQAALAPGNTSPKKGVGNSYMRATVSQLLSLGVSWTHSWNIGYGLLDQNYYDQVPLIMINTYDENTIRQTASSHPGKYWLIFNEPDGSWSSDYMNGDQAATNYYYLRSIIKSADPTAKLIVGGTYYEDLYWLTNFRQAYQKKYGSFPEVEGWHSHLYMDKDSYRKDVWQSKVNYWFTWMQGNGGIKEFWLTEFGCLNSESVARQIMIDQIPFLESLPWLTRYAWYATDADPPEMNTGFTGSLIDRNTGELTSLGQLYATYGNPPDATPPSNPTSLTVIAISSSQINLIWTTSTDNIGVTGYRIYRGGSQIATSATNSYSDTGLSPSTSYTYTVEAYDAAGNASSQSSSASATTQSGPPPSGGLVAAYSFNEGSGTTAADSSGNNNIGTLVNGPTWAQGKYGNALSFNGTNNYVNTGNNSILNFGDSLSYSVEFWVKSNETTPNGRDILGKISAGGGSQRIHFYINSGILMRWEDFSGPTISSSKGWQHIAYTYSANGANNGTEKFYENGVSSWTRTGVVPAWDSTDNWTIGAGMSGSWFFNGLIDEVRIYNCALTQAEIQTDMNTPIGGIDTTPPSAPSEVTVN